MSPVPEAFVLGGWPEVDGAIVFVTTGFGVAGFLTGAVGSLTTGFSGLGGADFSTGGGTVVPVAAGVTGWSYEITRFHTATDAVATSAANNPTPIHIFLPV